MRAPGRPSVSTLLALGVIGILAIVTVVAALTVMEPPESVTEEGDDITALYNAVMAAALFVFFGVEALLVWVLFRYRRRSDEEPAQVHGNNRLEMVWTAIPIVILVALFVPSAFLVVALRDPVDPDLEVDVVGRQWFWEYSYPEEGIEIGRYPTMRIPTRRHWSSRWTPRSN